ncbi:hypothetical protein ACSQ67_020695 [Phaseolus vulgaris]
MLPGLDLNAPFNNSHPLQIVTPLMDSNKTLLNHENQHDSNNQVHAKFPILPLDIDLNIPYNEASMVDSNEGFVNHATQHHSKNGGNQEDSDKLTQDTKFSIFPLDLDLNIPYIDSIVNDNEASNKGLINGGTQHVSNNGGNEEERDKLIQGRAIMPRDIDLNTSYVDNEASMMD